MPPARTGRVSDAVVYEEDQGYIDAVTGAADDLFSRVALLDADDLARQEVGEPRSTAPGLVNSRGGRVEITSDGGRTLSIEIDRPAGYLVISDTWLQGWNATLDGEHVPVLRANYAFRAVRVPAGRHRVVMWYGPFDN